MSLLKRISPVLFSHWFYLLASSVIVIIISYLSPTNKNQRSLPWESEKQRQTCAVLQVIDGDSLRLQCLSRQLEIRMEHIDAPEMQQQYWGVEAKRQLSTKVGKSVQVEISGQDVYHRYLATVWQAEENINLAMVVEGLARVYSNYRPPKAYLVAMQQARAKKRGIWSKPGLQQDPQRWRRLMH